jgi:hypothetical protein
LAIVAPFAANAAWSAIIKGFLGEFADGLVATIDRFAPGAKIVESAHRADERSKKGAFGARWLPPI